MNFKKIWLYPVLMLLLVASVGFVYAAEESVDGIQFNIPDGYTAGTEDVDDNGLFKTVSNNFTKDGDVITISVKSPSSDSQSFNNDMNPEDAVEKTINNKNGYLLSENNEYKFSYKEDNKHMVTITVSDEAMLENIII